MQESQSNNNTIKKLKAWETSYAKAKVNISIVVLLQIACEEVNTDNFLASPTSDVSFIDACHFKIDAISKTTAHHGE